MRILILKHPVDAQRIVTGLGNLGHEFLFASSTDSAIDLLKQNEVDLIIVPSNPDESESFRLSSLKDKWWPAIPMLSVATFNNDSQRVGSHLMN